MTFNNAIPTGNQRLSDSQPQLLANNVALNTWTNIDHYQLVDGTSNSGKHKAAHWPAQVADPVPLVSEPIIYAKDIPGLGVVNFSRFGNSFGNAVPSPITYFQSDATASSLPANGNVLNIYDLGNLTQLFGVVIAADSVTAGSMIYTPISWNKGPNVFQTLLASSGILSLILAGTTLQLKNVTSPSSALNNIYWTFIIYRAIT